MYRMKIKIENFSNFMKISPADTVDPKIVVTICKNKRAETTKLYNFVSGELKIENHCDSPSLQICT